MGDLAKRALLDEPVRLRIGVVVVALVPDLQEFARALGGLCHLARFVDAVGDSFLAELMFARLQRVEGHRRVQVQRSGDDDRLDVFAFQQGAVVAVALRAELRQFDSANAVRRVDVAHGDHLRAGHAHQLAQEVLSLRARADDADLDLLLLVRAGNQRAKRRGGGCHCAALQKLATGHAHNRIIPRVCGGEVYSCG